MDKAIDLSGLNPSEFEHLANALVIEVLGNGATSFGPGPDGGRDGIFKGKALYPSETENWDGLWIIQSKFHAPHLSKDPQKWLIAQLKEEFKRYAEKDSDRFWPDNMIVITNIDPSGTPKTGSYDVILSELKKNNPELAKRFHIWGGSKVMDLLFKYPNIRERYSHFITPGNVLNELRASIKTTHANSETVIKSLITRAFDSQKHTKLDQAGSASDVRPGIHSLFIDLPFSCEEHSIERSHIYQYINSAASEIHRHSKIKDQETLKWKNNPKRSPVLIIKAGPGNGKSTLGQLYAQIQRAALILGDQTLNVNFQIENLAQDIKKFAEEKNWWPSSPRIPIFIELKEYAYWLNQKEKSEESKGILSYLSSILTKQIEETVQVRTLKNAISSNRWAIIFDGLDEVPQDSKDLVAKEIYTFIKHVSIEEDCDLFCLCTTRPQGYSGQFDELQAPYLELVHLEKNEALACAIPVIKIDRSEDESKIAINNLESALSSNSVHQLMKTPLQCHIMAVVVRDGQRPPNRKWKLFDNFYEVIKRRESNRNLPDKKIAHLLREQDKLLRAVHSRVGFMLHSLAETGKGAQTSLSRNKFNEIAENTAKHWQGEESTEIANTLKEATIDRLVLINTPDDGNSLRFDVRQLQEFFAAEFMYQKVSLAELTPRLTTIFKDAHWREVNHFILSAFIENDRGPELALAIGILHELNEGFENKRMHKRLALGGKIAIRLFQEGLVEQNQNDRAKFSHILRPYFSSTLPSSFEIISSIKSNQTQKWMLNYTTEIFLDSDPYDSITAIKYLLFNINKENPRFVDVSQKLNQLNSSLLDYMFSDCILDVERYRRPDSKLQDWVILLVISKLESADWRLFPKTIGAILSDDVIITLLRNFPDTNFVKTLKILADFTQQRNTKYNDVEMAGCTFRFDKDWSSLKTLNTSFPLNEIENPSGLTLLLKHVLAFLHFKSFKSFNEIFSNGVTASDIGFIPHYIRKYIPGVCWAFSDTPEMVEKVRSLGEAEFKKIISNKGSAIPISRAPTHVTLGTNNFDNDSLKKLFDHDSRLCFSVLTFHLSRNSLSPKDENNICNFLFNSIKNMSPGVENTFSILGKIAVHTDKNETKNLFLNLFKQQPTLYSKLSLPREINFIPLDRNEDIELVFPYLALILEMRGLDKVTEASILDTNFLFSKKYIESFVEKFEDLGPHLRCGLILYYILFDSLGIDRLPIDNKKILEAFKILDINLFYKYLIRSLKDSGTSKRAHELVDQLFLIHNENLIIRLELESLLSKWNEKSSMPVTSSYFDKRWMEYQDND